MIEVGATEAEVSLNLLLDRVESGEEVVISRHGKAVARVVPSAPATSSERTHAALERIDARARAAGLGKFDWEEWKAYRDEGRR